MSQELSNIQVVVLAAYALGADEHPVELEELAIRVHEFAPGRFAWRTQASWINLITVFDSLKDAKKARSGRLMGGNNESGWHLTKAGADWARRNNKMIGSTLVAREKVDRKIAKTRAAERTRLGELTAWEKFNSGEPVSEREAEAVFRLSEYATDHRRLLLVDRVRSLFTEDPAYGQFVEEMAAVVRRKRERINE